MEMIFVLGRVRRKAKRHVDEHALVANDKSEVALATLSRHLIVDGLTPEKERQVQVRSKGKRVVEGYRKKGDRTQTKNRSGQRISKMEQQLKASTWLCSSSL